MNPAVMLEGVMIVVHLTKGRLGRLCAEFDYLIEVGFLYTKRARNHAEFSRGLRQRGLCANLGGIPVWTANRSRWYLYTRNELRGLANIGAALPLTRELGALPIVGVAGIALKQRIAESDEALIGGWR